MSDASTPRPFALGLAVYTIRDLVSRDAASTLRQVAALGYRELDMYIRATGTEPIETRRLLDELGLSLVSARVATSALYRGFDRALDEARTLGALQLTLANVSLEERTTLTDWHELAALFNRCGEAAKKAGLAFCYHNHSFEYHEVEGRLPIDILTSETDASLVKIQGDVYWMSDGGRDPVREIARLGARLASLHLKDRANDTGGITTVGQGTLDFAAILDAAAAVGVRHAFVEQDDPSDPLAAIRAAAEHLRPILEGRR